MCVVLIEPRCDREVGVVGAIEGAYDEGGGDGKGAILPGLPRRTREEEAFEGIEGISWIASARLALVDEVKDLSRLRKESAGMMGCEISESGMNMDIAQLSRLRQSTSLSRYRIPLCKGLKTSYAQMRLGDGR